MSRETIYKYFPAEPQALDQLRDLELPCWSPVEPRFDLRCWVVDEQNPPDPGDERWWTIMEAWGGNEEELLAEWLEGADGESSKGIRKGARVVSLCEQPDNLLMWDRYAAALEGFCIEFSIDDVLSGTPAGALLLPVVYRSSPYRFDPYLRFVAEEVRDYAIHEADDAAVAQVLSDLCDRQFRDVITSAPVGMQDEHEWRLVFRSSPRYRYPPTALRSLIIGERTSAEVRRDLERTLAALAMTVPIRVAAMNRRTGLIEITD